MSHSLLSTLAFTFALLLPVIQAQINSSAPTCYWPNGSPADPSHLLPCSTSLSSDGFFACCPPSTASDLYPLDYPLCTANGLCKAGNSDFLARGGCTDSNWSSTSCPSYCPSKTATGMAGLTNCKADSYWWCCNDQHDDGSCECNPPAGSAFLLQGTRGKTFKDFMAGSTNGSVAVNGSSVSGTMGLVPITKTGTAATQTKTKVSGTATAKTKTVAGTGTKASASAHKNSSSVSVVYQTVSPTAALAASSAVKPSGTTAAATTTPSSAAAMMGRNLVAILGAVALGVAFVG